MKRIVVASKNPVKINAARIAFEQAFPGQQIDVQGLSADSEVADQPMSDEETLQGAINRTNNAKQASPDADFWVGIEGGISYDQERMDAFGWMVILDKNGRREQARSCTFPLPPYVAQRVLAGEELGFVNDAFFQMHNSKQGGGAVGSLTNKLITRTDLYVQPLLLALIPFMQPQLFSAAL